MRYKQHLDFPYDLDNVVTNVASVGIGAAVLTAESKPRRAVLSDWAARDSETRSRL